MYVREQNKVNGEGRHWRLETSADKVKATPKPNKSKVSCDLSEFIIDKLGQI